MSGLVCELTIVMSDDIDNGLIVRGALDALVSGIGTVFS